jgi:cyclohexyl-isocyanide hydratase
MNRREFNQLVALGALSSAAGGSTFAADQPAPAPTRQPTAGAAPPLQIAMLVHPDMVMLDLVGPQTVFALSVADVHLVWKDLRPVATDIGLTVQPTVTLADCPKQLDVLFVPGGLKGTVALLDDREVIAFLTERGQGARYVTSVCTGGLLLGAAGLLRGYRANTHWYVRDLLPLLGATAVDERVVVDRNRVTGGGVTAGLDFGLRLAALLRGDDYARRIQLVLEYDPKPPFDSGSPHGAGPASTDDVLKRRAPLLAAARAAAARARDRLGT